MNKKPLILMISLLLSSLLVSAASYTEPDLKALLLSNNLKLKQAISEQDLSTLEVKDAKAGYGPTVDLEVSGTYLANPMDTLSFELPFPLGSSTPVTIDTGLTNTLYNFSLTLTQPLWTWGKLKNGVAMTEKLVQIRQAQRFALQKSLLSELSSRLYAHHYLLAMEGLFDEEQKLAQTLVTLAEEGVSNGMLLKEEALSAKVSLRQIALAKTQVANQRQQQRRAIANLCNITIDEGDELVGELDQEQLRSLLSYDLKSLQALATAKSQEQVRIANLMTDLAALASSVAEGSLYWKPDMAMQVSLGYGGSKFLFVERDDYNFNVSVGMKSTIYDGGKKFHEVSRKAIKEEQSYFDKDQMVQALLTQVEEAYLALHLADESLAYLSLKREAALSEGEQKRLLFASGYGSEADLVKAELARVAIECEMEQQWLAYTGAFATITYLCGLENRLL